MTAEIIFLVFLMVCALTLGFLVLVLAKAVVYIIPMLNGPVYVPSADEDVAKMIKLAKLKKGERVVDLGSGDGKIVIELAKQGFRVDGYEINPFLVKKSQAKIAELNLEKKATIHAKSLWRADLSQYNVVMLYGTTYIMPKLQNKARRELPKGARIISNFFTFPEWQPAQVDGEIYRYEQ